MTLLPVNRESAIINFSIGVAGLLAAASASSVPTFTRNVAPILQDHCQCCHRAGEVAPTSLITYKEARHFAAAIKEAVSLRKMPPWFTGPHYGNPRMITLARELRGMSQIELATVLGIPQGSLSKMETGDAQTFDAIKPKLSTTRTSGKRTKP